MQTALHGAPRAPRLSRLRQGGGGAHGEQPNPRAGKAAIEHLDAEAAALGLSRNEYLRRRLEREASALSAAPITAEDWSRSAATFGDLAGLGVIDAA